jgi:hypothetical protein
MSSIGICWRRDEIHRNEKKAWFSNKFLLDYFSHCSLRLIVISHTFQQQRSEKYVRDISANDSQLQIK